MSCSDVLRIQTRTRCSEDKSTLFKNGIFLFSCGQRGILLEGIRISSPWTTTQFPEI